MLATEKVLFQKGLKYGKYELMDTIQVDVYLNRGLIILNNLLRPLFDHFEQSFVRGG